MEPNGLAAASTISGHFSASCCPITASWFSARASARALMASASAVPLALTAAPSAMPFARVGGLADRRLQSLLLALPLELSDLGFLDYHVLSGRRLREGAGLTRLRVC